VENPGSSGILGLLGFTSATVDQVIAMQEALGRYKINYSQAPIVDRKYWGVSNKTDWEVGNITVRNIFGYRDAESFVNQDTDGGDYASLGGAPLPPGAPVFNANMATDMSQLTNEFQVLGYAGNWEWIVGAFYMDQES